MIKENISLWFYCKMQRVYLSTLLLMIFGRTDRRNTLLTFAQTKTAAIYHDSFGAGNRDFFSKVRYDECYGSIRVSMVKIFQLKTLLKTRWKINENM